MSADTQNPQQEPVQAETQKNDKEYNFSQLRKQMDVERAARLKAEQEAAELRAKTTQSQPVADDDDSYDEPYTDKKYVKSRISKSEQKIKEEAKREARDEMRQMLIEEKRSAWLKANPDFQEVMQHAQKFADADPELAETILEMPECFERQKLVYKNIKALGLHKPKVAEESVQAKIDKNRKSPYYQPSSMGAAPYGNSGDFSAAGQKSAFDHMRALQQKMRLG
jgi:hypothetical protein